MSRDHRKLTAFQLADGLVTDIYGATRRFPREEIFGLTSQMRRSSVSVAANIVEGAARSTERDYARFLDMAVGSLRELGYYIGLAHRLGCLTAADAASLSDQYEETGRVLGALRNAIAKRSR